MCGEFDFRPMRRGRGTTSRPSATGRRWRYRSSRPWGRSQHLIHAEGVRCAAVAVPFPDRGGSYDVRLEYLADAENKAEYRILVGGRLIGSHQSEPGHEPPEDEPSHHYFRDVKVETGQEIRVEANAREGSRARWRRLFLYGK